MADSPLLPNLPPDHLKSSTDPARRTSPQRLAVTLYWDTTERGGDGLFNIKHVVLVEYQRLLTDKVHSGAQVSGLSWTRRTNFETDLFPSSSPVETVHSYLLTNCITVHN